MSGFRIRSRAIKFTSGDSHRTGVKADVIQAKFRRWYSIRGQLVAVKRLRSIHTEKGRDDFIHEVEMMKGLSHRNVVQLTGFVEEFENGTAWIILSWEPNGNISDFLAKGKWEIPERISLVKDTFEGIKYLHNCQPPICHGNLKSSNILVNSSYRAVLTGFGSAREICEPEDEAIDNESDQKVLGTPSAEETCSAIQIAVAGNQLTLTGPAWSLHWDSPEVINNGKRPGLSSDIWTAGWVCWEVITDDVPFSELNSSGMITSTVTQGDDPSPHALHNLMKNCLAFNPKARPSISRCCNELQRMPSTPPLGGDILGSRVPSTNLLRQKGRLHYCQGNYEKSCLLFQQALSLARSGGNQIAAAQSLFWLGAGYRAQSKYAQAEDSYSQAQKIYARKGNNLARADTLTELGNVYRDQSTFSQAEESYTRAQEIYTRAESDLGRANTLYGLGSVAHAQFKYPRAEQLFTQAQEIYTRIGDDPGRASALNKLGNICCLRSGYTQAEGLYNQAQESYARIGSELGRANTLHGLGDVYCYQSKYSQAEELYTQAQEIYSRIGNEQGRGNTLLGLGRVCHAQSKDTRAEELCIQAQEIFTRLDCELGQANTLDILGDVYRLQSRYVQAEDSHNRAQEFYGRLGCDLGRANTLLELGRLYHDQSRYTQAEESYSQAQDIYIRFGQGRGRAYTVRGIGHLRRDLGCKAEAAAHYAEARDLFARIGMTREVEDVSRWLADVLPDHGSPSTEPQGSIRADGQCHI